LPGTVIRSSKIAFAKTSWRRPPENRGCRRVEQALRLGPGGRREDDVRRVRRERAHEPRVGVEAEQLGLRVALAEPDVDLVVEEPPGVRVVLVLPDQDVALERVEPDRLAEDVALAVARNVSIQSATRPPYDGGRRPSIRPAGSSSAAVGTC
jgi:hypothetical protein